MAKEEYETPLIDVYNRTHMDALHEDGAWYHRFLPEGVFLEDLGQIVEEELIKAYNEVEREADEFFNNRVKERFEEIFAQANPKDLRGLLPKKPPVAWAESHPSSLPEPQLPFARPQSHPPSWPQLQPPPPHFQV